MTEDRTPTGGRPDLPSALKAVRDYVFVSFTIPELDRRHLLEFIDAAPAAEPVPLTLDAHPDTPHEFRTVCRLCGENGYLHVALITDLEVVKIEPRAASPDKGEPRP